MHVNTLSPAPGARRIRRRRGRGIGSGRGKTCGRGCKGQKSRSGGYRKVGFEGGQMPLQRRLPKVGFRSRLARVTVDLRVGQLMRLPQGNTITVETLREGGVIGRRVRRVKLIAGGELQRPVTVRGIRAAPGALAAIEAAGGRVEAVEG